MKLVKEETKEILIKSAKDISNYLKEFQDEDREYFISIGLTTKNKILYREIISIGTLDAAPVHPRETFKKAIMHSAKSIIVAHNHPSGDPEPSKDDLDICRKLKEAGEILSIPITDFIIIGNDDKYWSYEEENK